MNKEVCYEIETISDNLKSVTIKTMVDERTLLLQLTDDLLSMPFSALQESSNGVILPGRYFHQSGDVRVIDLLVSNDYVSFLINDKVNGCNQTKKIFYNLKDNKLVFMWRINDEINSSHYVKLYHNYETLELDNQKMSPEELDNGLKLTLNEVKEFVGLNDALKQVGSIEEIEENIWKYYKGNIR